MQCQKCMNTGTFHLEVECSSRNTFILGKQKIKIIYLNTKQIYQKL